MSIVINGPSSYCEEHSPEGPAGEACPGCRDARVAWEAMRLEILGVIRNGIEKPARGLVKHVPSARDTEAGLERLNAEDELSDDAVLVHNEIGEMPNRVDKFSTPGVITEALEPVEMPLPEFGCCHEDVSVSSAGAGAGTPVVPTVPGAVTPAEPTSTISEATDIASGVGATGEAVESQAPASSGGNGVTA